MEVDYTKIETELNQIKGNLAYLDLLPRLRDSFGIPIFQNVSIGDADVISFMNDIKPYTGVLQTSNAKRKSQSNTLILNGCVIECQYMRSAELLKEKLWICWKAVERDLESSKTSVSFYSVDEPIIRSAAAYFRGQHQFVLADVSIQSQVEEILREHAHKSDSGIIISIADNIAFYTFFADGALVGNFAAIRTSSGDYKFGSSRDLSLLCFESKKNPKARIDLFTLSKVQKEEILANSGF